MSQTRTQDLDLTCQTCSECGAPKEFVLDILGRPRKVPTACKCDTKKYERIKEQQERADKMRKLDSLRRYSLMGRYFERCTFENWKHDETNKRWYELGKTYCEEWQKVEKHNTGMLLYGAPGTGKSYLSF